MTSQWARARGRDGENRHRAAMLRSTDRPADTSSTSTTTTTKATRLALPSLLDLRSALREQANLRSQPPGPTTFSSALLPS